MTEHHAADGARDETERIRAEREHRADERIGRRKEEPVEDERGGRAVQKEVVPLDRGADQARGDDFRERRATTSLHAGELLHEARDILRRMKNVTVTLSEKAAAWARVEAAKQNMSVSRLIGELLEQRMVERREYENAMRRFLAKKPRKLKEPGEHFPTRAELYDRPRVR
jgi:hypothetical protein